MVVFRSGQRTFGIPVERVTQVFPVVEIAPLPGAPVPVRGVVNVHGRMTPVIDLGRRFGTSWSDVHLDARLIFVDTGARAILVLADDIDGVRTVPKAPVASASTLGGVLLLDETDFATGHLLSPSEADALDAVWPHV